MAVVKRIIVGARYGLRGWLVQRVTALVMATYTVLVAVILIAAPPRHYGLWKALFAHQWMKVATFVFLLSVAAHAWIGMRDILMDYVQPTAWRLAAQVLVILALLAYTGWSLQILWSA